MQTQATGKSLLLHVLQPLLLCHTSHNESRSIHESSTQFGLTPMDGQVEAVPAIWWRRQEPSSRCFRLTLISCSRLSFVFHWTCARLTNAGLSWVVKNVNFLHWTIFVRTCVKQHFSFLVKKQFLPLFMHLRANRGDYYYVRNNLGFLCLVCVIVCVINNHKFYT